jgi:hypothetical protein
MCGQPCSTSYQRNCGYDFIGCSLGTSYFRCMGYPGGPKTCEGVGNPCIGPSYCFDVQSRQCL